MELQEIVVNTPPRDSASVVLLRNSPSGLEVLLMRRHSRSNVLGGAYVFPGGKLEWDDSADAMMQRLDAPVADLHAALGEPELSVPHAAGLFAAALREAFEESGVLLATCDGQVVDAGLRRQAAEALRKGTAFSKVITERDWLLDTGALAPWSRWITPRRPSAAMTRRFDTRFFLAAVPGRQEAHHDNFELTEARWLTPRQALEQYRNHEIEMAPPQIVCLMCLLPFADTVSALADARSRLPPLIEPCRVEPAEEHTICYPGDPAHPVAVRALPTTTRMVWRDKRFQPPEGFASLLDSTQPG